MNLSNDERDLVEIYRDATRDKNTDMLIAIYAIIQRLLEKQGDVPPDQYPDQLSGFTKGEYKRAIKNLRQAQVRALRTGNPDMAAEFDLSIQCIRERCLRKVPAAA
ncbi:hypothetical protein [Oscillibacter sp.]|uniref:hypothetical protein n=1 Tax=Oscillibacter sp. TaxID=1945593 RepID=UPI00289AED36|nr:hypothetical protein [Oscillibacter sp.]